MKQTAARVAVRRREWTIVLTAALALAVAVLAALPARAQYDGLPVGDWRQYCNNARMDGNELKAHCRARNGQMVYVEANVSSCGGVVSYDVGQTKFFCASRGSQGYPPGGGQYYPGGQGFASDGLPNGNWRQFCTNARMDGPELKAQCRAANGQLVYVEANISSCGGVVSYNVGQSKFFCGNQGGGQQGYGGQNYGQGGFPPGSWSQSCTNASMQGSLLRAQCRNNFGQYTYAQIDANQCYNGVWNNNGQLRCQ